MSAYPLASAQRQDDEYKKDQKNMRVLKKPHAFKRARDALNDVLDRLPCRLGDNHPVTWSTRPKAMRIYDDNGSEVVHMRPKKRCVAYCLLEEPLRLPCLNVETRFIGVAGDGATENATDNVERYYVCAWLKASEWRIIGLRDFSDGVWIPPSSFELIGRMVELGLPNNSPGRVVRVNRQKRSRQFGCAKRESMESPVDHCMVEDLREESDKDHPFGCSSLFDMVEGDCISPFSSSDESGFESPETQDSFYPAETAFPTAEALPPFDLSPECFSPCEDSSSSSDYSGPFEEATPVFTPSDSDDDNFCF